MAGAHIDIHVDDRNLRQVLHRLAGRVTDATPIMSAIGEALVHSTWRRFEAERGPDGSGWRPLQDDYAIHRAGGTAGNTLRRGGMRAPFLRRLASQKILNATSRLKDSIAYRADANSVQVGTNVVYGAIHQLGGTIKPVRGRFLRFEINGRIIFARQVTIPARPFLGLDAADERTIADIIEARLL